MNPLTLLLPLALLASRHDFDLKETMHSLALQARIKAIVANVPPTLEEREIGVRRAAYIGSWRVRTGILTKDGAKALGLEPAGQQFAYATLTNDAHWTLGVRAIERVPGEPVKTVFYLQTPAGYSTEGSVHAERFNTKDELLKTMDLNRLLDGTLHLDEPLTKGRLKLNLLEHRLSFSLSDLPTVLRRVEFRPAIATVPATVASPRKPLPR